MMQRTLQHKYEDILTNESVARSIVVHVRRGDYLYLPRVYGILNEDYFARAVARARKLAQRDSPKQAQVLVFSDDLDWCRKQSFFAEDTKFVDEKADIYALTLMARFKRFVISNSTFSWWAAVLSRDTEFVIAPDKHFGPDGF